MATGKYPVGDKGAGLAYMVPTRSSYVTGTKL